MRHHLVSTLVAMALLLALRATADASPVTPTYFLAAERPGLVQHHDSYVLPLTDALQIAHARDLLARGPAAAGESIVFASIARGADQINRNLVAPSQSNWSWHVTDVSGFGDVGIELLDGTPTYVEEHLTDWMRETDGKIGFWNYTVTTELIGYPEKVPPVPVPLPAAIPATLAALAIIVPISRVAARRRRH